MTRSASRPAGSTTCSTSSARRTCRPGCSTCTWQPGRRCPQASPPPSAPSAVSSTTSSCPPPSTTRSPVSARSATRCPPEPARLAVTSTRPTYVSPACAKVPSGWPWCRCAESSPPSPSSSAKWPRPPARTSSSSLDGEDVELDARVLDGVAEALGHLVTNAVDHGCGSPEERRLAGKSSRATVRVTARAAGSSVIIEVADDGPGVDEDEIRATAVHRGLLRRGLRPRRPAPARPALRARLQHPRGGDRDLRARRRARRRPPRGGGPRRHHRGLLRARGRHAGSCSRCP